MTDKIEHFPDQLEDWTEMLKSDSLTKNLMGVLIEEKNPMISINALHNAIGNLIKSPFIPRYRLIGFCKRAIGNYTELMEDKQK